MAVEMAAIMPGNGALIRVRMKEASVIVSLRQVDGEAAGGGFPYT